MYRSVLIVAVISLLLGSVVVSPVAAGGSGDDVAEPMVHVDVSADGDATVSLVSVYELTDDDERNAFESLEEDEEAQQEFRDRFSDRMESVAESVGEDGASAITDESISVRTEGEFGIVTVSVGWTGFAEVDGETLIVTEPFASNFEADRQLVIAGPEDASIESTSHEPLDEKTNQASWEAGAELDGFEMVISLEHSESDETSVGSNDAVPGFGVIPAVITITVGLGMVVFMISNGRSRAE